MLTGDGDVATAVDCLKLGASDYISKPFLGHEVRARIDKALAERRLTLEVRRLRESYNRDLERQVQDLSRKNQAMFLAQVQMAVTMLEAKDPYTRGHSGRVAEYAVATGRKMGISGRLLEQLRLGGELHDIGKIGTRDAVLRTRRGHSPTRSLSRSGGTRSMANRCSMCCAPIIPRCSISCAGITSASTALAFPTD